MRSTLKCGIMPLDKQGNLRMKTKIIYISGGETFNLCEIRAAFDQVRDLLHMGNDTIMFGVPVDKEDVLEDNQITQISTLEQSNTDVAPVNDDTSDALSQDSILPESDDSVMSDVLTTDDIVNTSDTETTTPVATPIKKSRGRQKKSDIITSDNDTKKENTDTTENVQQSTENKVISILSVLTSKKNEPEVDAAEYDTDYAEKSIEYADESDDTDIDMDTDTVSTDVDDTTPDTPDYMIVSETEIGFTTDTTDMSSEYPDEEIESVHEMISDEEPTSPIEHTLEQLLESMTPLREDIEHERMDDNLVSDDTNTDEDIIDDSDLDIVPDSLSDADATLEKLANEFAEHEQDITKPVARSTSQGKIGKLKNILPFKKAKHDDTGLMGDLFGWAGIAANDEDFAIPGFFTNAASNK